MYLLKRTASLLEVYWSRRRPDVTPPRNGASSERGGERFVGSSSALVLWAAHSHGLCVLPTRSLGRPHCRGYRAPQRNSQQTRALPCSPMCAFHSSKLRTEIKTEATPLRSLARCLSTCWQSPRRLALRCRRGAKPIGASSCKECPNRHRARMVIAARARSDAIDAYATCYMAERKPRRKELRVRPAESGRARLGNPSRLQLASTQVAYNDALDGTWGSPAMLAH